MCAFVTGALRAMIEPEFALFLAKPDGGRMNLQLRQTDRRQDLLIEPCAGGQVAHADGDVIDHDAGAPAFISL
jgi:hypothetical protein